MYMKNKTLVLSLVFLLALQVFFTVRMYRENMESKKTLGKIQEEFTLLYNSLNSYMNLQEKMSCHYINTSVQATNRSGKKIEISEILQDSINTIFYVPHSSCHSCNESIFQNLPHVIELMGGRLKIICSPADFNAMVIYSNHTVTEQTLFAVDEPLINHKIFDSPAPCIINITNRGQVKSVFVIDNTNIVFFNNYLSIVKSFWDINSIL